MTDREVSLRSPAPRLLAVTPENAARAPEVCAVWIEGLLDGLSRSRLRLRDVALQVRDKQATDSQVESLIEQLSRRLDAAVGENGIRLVLNAAFCASTDRAEFAHLGGVHLPSRHYPDELQTSAERTTSDGFLIGASTHSLNEISNLPSSIDYAVFGPVFDTPSKRRFGEPLGVARLREAVEARTSLPVLAIGGIDAENIERTLASGCHGVAAIRSLGTPQRTEAVANALADRGG